MTTPRELSFLDANKITQHHLSISEMCQRCLGHVSSKTAHGEAELRHVIDSNVEKLANQCCISMHNDFVRRVEDGKQAKVGAWIYRQLASINIFHAVLDQETIDVSLLATTNCTGDLVISIANRWKPFELSFTLQIHAATLLDRLSKFLHQILTIVMDTVIINIYHENHSSHSTTSRSVHAHLHRHNFHINFFAVDKQILIRKRWLSDDVEDVTTSKDTLISLKLLYTSLLINFTTGHVILARSLHEAMNALKRRQTVSVTNIVTGWTFRVNMLALGKVA